MTAADANPVSSASAHRDRDVLRFFVMRSTQGWTLDRARARHLIDGLENDGHAPPKDCLGAEDIGGELSPR